MTTTKASAAMWAVCFVVATATAPVLARAEAPPPQLCCNPLQLIPCLSSLVIGSTPTSRCCGGLNLEQRCLCGYMSNPLLKTYYTGYFTRVVQMLAHCQIPYPICLN
ncbi:hypothetical protein SAY87_022802 [Trapa incisa]|uniref:Bifunctional inhibitor/plant lipid transfer protein/seed storage helical domain-containing protein n=1 Tax=Trapa incisa TaxID=236973 RepID=A0AAN7K4D8_9MYRT|nr:hypothetical protein SAY87_022802 [Trapa incisa]